MTLVRTDGDGYKVISDIGEEYLLAELVTYGASEVKSHDKVVIVHCGTNAEDGTPKDTIVDYYYGTNELLEREDLAYIKRAINNYESVSFADSTKIDGDIIATF